MPDGFLLLLQASSQAMAQAFAALAVPAVAFLALATVLRRKSFWSDIRRVLPETRLNILLMAVNAATVTPVIAFLSVVVTGALRDRGLILIGPDTWRSLPLPVVILFGVVVGDFVAYWRHRFEHCALLWPSHAIHHSDTQMTWLTIERFHPVNRLSTFCIDMVALAVLGLPPAAIVANNLVRHYYGLYIHADLDWTYGRLGKIFVSPAMHRWHHAKDEAAMNTNFATMFSLYDYMFGTFYLPGPCRSPLGVKDGPGRGLVSQLAYPFDIRAYRGGFQQPTEATVSRS